MKTKAGKGSLGRWIQRRCRWFRGLRKAHSKEKGQNNLMLSKAESSPPPYLKENLLTTCKRSSSRSGTSTPGRNYGTINSGSYKTTTPEGGYGYPIGGPRSDDRSGAIPPHGSQSNSENCGSYYHHGYYSSYHRGYPTGVLSPWPIFCSRHTFNDNNWFGLPKLLPRWY